MSIEATRRERFCPGFEKPVFDSQRTFRVLLNAMAHPGRIFRLEVNIEAPPPFYRASAAVALALVDFNTFAWADLPLHSEAVQWLRFHCGCPVAKESVFATFALVTDCRSLLPLNRFHPGTDESPGDSATLIVQVSDLTSAGGLRLSGPGIQEAQYLAVSGLGKDFWDEWKVNHSLYPLGVDLILTRGEFLAALPRTTRVDEGEI
jgi:alpha-D-ribose 1-methylphosphonate 5-triphosphate synthase subunit PhnH